MRKTPVTAWIKDIILRNPPGLYIRFGGYALRACQLAMAHGKMRFLSPRGFLKTLRRAHGMINHAGSKKTPAAALSHSKPQQEGKSIRQVSEVLNRHGIGVTA